MEEKNAFFSTELHLVILLLVSCCCSLANGGLGTDQASSLMALRQAKMLLQQNTLINSEDSWAAAEMNVAGEVLSTDTGNMDDDLIRGGLPGQPSGATFKQFAGYVNVDERNGRSLFYYFAEAAQNASSKPLILWLNGGPGCSSFGMGAMVELGPFGVNPDGKTLYSRRFSWNKVANTLFLESPAGVGFSYSNTTTDYGLSGDKRTAADAYTFLVNWFKRFPQYQGRDFYIMGESYAGFYIPELADIIVQRNKKMVKTPMIQLKGIMIGNGIINDLTDQTGWFDFMWSHALISDETHRQLQQCSSKGSSGSSCAFPGEELGDIDPYNIYGPLCLNSLSSSRKAKRLVGYDPCEGIYVQKYLNLPQVQEALHANRTKLPYTWQVCSVVINGWNDSPSTMFPIYRRFFEDSLRVLLYSGDVDAVVPVTGTRYSINAMKLKVIKPWRPWFDDTDAVAGYRVVYDGLTLATVRGAGHQVPQFQPRRAFALLEKFLSNRF